MDTGKYSRSDMQSLDRKRVITLLNTICCFCNLDLLVVLAQVGTLETTANIGLTSTMILSILHVKVFIMVME